MSDRLKLREKRSAEGEVIPNCWVTVSGYTVALTRLASCRFAIMRPGGDAPFAYTGNRSELAQLIFEDERSRR